MLENILMNMPLIRKPEDLRKAGWLLIIWTGILILREWDKFDGVKI